MYLTDYDCNTECIIASFKKLKQVIKIILSSHLKQMRWTNVGAREPASVVRKPVVGVDIVGHLGSVFSPQQELGYSPPREQTAYTSMSAFSAT